MTTTIPSCTRCHSVLLWTLDRRALGVCASCAASALPLPAAPLPAPSSLSLDALEAEVLRSSTSVLLVAPDGQVTNLFEEDFPEALRSASFSVEGDIVKENLARLRVGSETYTLFSLLHEWDNALSEMGIDDIEEVYEALADLAQNPAAITLISSLNTAVDDPEIRPIWADLDWVSRLLDLPETSLAYAPRLLAWNTADHAYVSLASKTLASFTPTQHAALASLMDAEEGGIWPVRFGELLGRVAATIE